MAAQGGNRFSALLLEGLDHYRKGRMLDAVRAWEEAYLLEPTNLRAREFLRSALERIHAVMSPGNKPAAAAAQAPHPWLPPQPPAAAPKKTAGPPPAAPKGNAAARPAPVPTQPPPPAQKKPAAAAPPKNPWDEGPSLAIPQPEMTGEGNGAWSIHKDQAPAQNVADDEAEVW